MGGSATANLVEEETKQAYGWLVGNIEFKLHYACLVIRELAENAPTFFNIHIGEFFDKIWPSLRHQKLFIREVNINNLI